MISGIWIGWYYLIGNGNDGVVINAGWTGIIVIRQNSAHHCYKVGKLQHPCIVAHVSLKQNNSLTIWALKKLKMKNIRKRTRMNSEDKVPIKHTISFRDIHVCIFKFCYLLVHVVNTWIIYWYKKCLRAIFIW